jgi:hypothetical protein
MLLISLRFLALMLAALTAGMSFAHVLERPAKMRYDAALYGTLQKTLYAYWGPPNVGALVIAFPIVFLRARWEDGHVIRFAFHLCALGLLILSVLSEMDA